MKANQNIFSILEEHKLTYIERIDKLQIQYDSMESMNCPHRLNKAIRDLLINKQYQEALSLCMSQMVNPMVKDLKYGVDTYKSMNDLGGNVMPFLPSSCLNAVVNLKIILDIDLTASDMWGLRPDGTDRPHKHNYVAEFESYYEKLFNEYQETQNVKDFIKDFFLIDHIPKEFSYYGQPLIYPDDFFFSVTSCFPLSRQFISMDREAENRARKDIGLPGVGEGWVSEMQTLKAVKDQFNEYTVIHQARLPFLGLQSLDIYVSELKLGIEYQGQQHFKPVKHFGGKRGLKATQERDQRKAQLCKKNGVDLRYVNYTENIERAILLIKESIS